MEINKSDATPTYFMPSIIIAIITSYIAIAITVPSYVFLFIFITSLIIVVVYYFLSESDVNISLVFGVRLIFRYYYKVKTDSNSTIYLLSKEKLQQGRKIKAVHIMNNVYSFAYIIR